MFGCCSWDNKDASCSAALLSFLLLFVSFMFFITYCSGENKFVQMVCTLLQLGITVTSTVTSKMTNDLLFLLVSCQEHFSVRTLTDALIEKIVTTTLLDRVAGRHLFLQTTQRQTEHQNKRDIFEGPIRLRVL